MTKLNDIGDWNAYQCGFGQCSVSYMSLRLDCEGRLDDCHNISIENVNPVQKLLCPTQPVYANEYPILQRYAMCHAKVENEITFTFVLI